jgi:hypothetical protein
MGIVVVVFLLLWAGISEVASFLASDRDLREFIGLLSPCPYELTID